MLRLFLSSALLAPLVSTPFLVSAEDRSDDIDRPSYEEAYVLPVIEKLQQCESAELDVFFSDQWIETHSAQHLGDTIRVASDCENISYVIEPRASGLVGSYEEDTLSAQMRELSLTLAAYGADAKVQKIRIQEDPDAFLLNGRAAVLKIIVNDKEAA